MGLSSKSSGTADSLTSWITPEALLTQLGFCSVSSLLHRVITKLSAMRHRKPKIHSSRPQPFRNCQSLCAKSLQLSPAPCDPVDCSPPGSSVRGDSPGKNTGVGCHALLQGIFLTQGSDPHLLHWLAGSSPLVPPGKPAPLLRE